MGMPREMVSDVGYALMVAFVLARPAKGSPPEAMLEAILDLYERRYRDGRSGEPLVENGRGRGGGLIKPVATRHGLHPDTLRDADRRFRAVSLAALKAAGLTPRAMLKEPEQSPAPPRPAPSKPFPGTKPAATAPRVLPGVLVRRPAWLEAPR